MTRRFRTLNEVQIQAIANLLLEIGKWLLLSVVFSALFTEGKIVKEKWMTVVALILAFILILLAVRLLREVKKK